ncbi:MAG TPA: SIMPL domain-containing protein [Gammaproteobacteria bacterium]|jgi:hypothetical protein|nr:SIMPL domain-containing protein [Gammaproteobacteria bacterium]
MAIKKPSLILGAVILSIGVLGAGYSIGWGMYQVRKMNRVTTVKGIAERDVKSDLAIWEINYREIGNDLVQLNQKLQQDRQTVEAFLKEQGFSDAEITRGSFKVEDRFANVYSQTSQNPNDQRYVLIGGTRVRSPQVELVQKSVDQTDKLLQAGVPLAFDVSGFFPNPSYYFMGLDSIRPSMMADATKSARTLADQFAKDASCTLGGIQRASQGVFQIMSRDTSTMNSDWSSNESALGTINKKVRLVTTLEYRLK